MEEVGADGRTEMCGATGEVSGRNPSEYLDSVPNPTATRDEPNLEYGCLLEAVVERENMKRALQRVKSNQGSAGVDNMPLSELEGYLKQAWSRIKEELLAGRYMPQPVRKVEIPKPGGKGVRMLGIPTVLDRLIQQALNQVLQPIFDKGFSDSSYGFRAGRSAHDAVRKARDHVASGKRWTVDMDLEKFFDRVNHDILMSRVARKVGDERILMLIRRYLESGMMAGGVVSQRTQGTPQGGPLSPLLSNILLDDLDKKLERDGHTFSRYADDCNIYVASKQAGERVLATVSRYLEEELKLKVNQEKSAVDRPWKRTFLGYSMTFHKVPRLKVARGSVKRFKSKLKEQFRMGRGRNLQRFIGALTPVLRGWANYYKLSEVKGIFEDLDGWIRRKLRAIIWRQWKRTYTRARNLMRRGLTEERAWRSATNQRGAWWNAGASHMNAAFPKKFFDRLGLLSLLRQRQRLQSLT
uniref:RNA-directed DNA polymerase (Reverse transcriptase) n=1 Tax=Magnetococcus massalia (strain MO-1) TaxID=451514 RepID=A0A1S7LDY0_MAGMO|nr:RNA-directed DNA polymerase (Reverse transcriptase) [Candidatus Magnetococcus massalia]